jgi:hypothetical protein
VWNSSTGITGGTVTDTAGALGGITTITVSGDITATTGDIVCTTGNIYANGTGKDKGGFISSGGYISLIGGQGSTNGGAVTLSAADIESTNSYELFFPTTSPTANNQILVSDSGGYFTWANGVTGPNSSINNAIAIWSGIEGNNLENTYSTLGSDGTLTLNDASGKNGSITMHTKIGTIRSLTLRAADTQSTSNYTWIFPGSAPDSSSKFLTGSTSGTEPNQNITLSWNTAALALGIEENSNLGLTATETGSIALSNTGLPSGVYTFDTTKGHTKMAISTDDYGRITSIDIS